MSSCLTYVNEMYQQHADTLNRIPFLNIKAKVDRIKSIYNGLRTAVDWIFVKIPNFRAWYRQYTRPN